MNEFRIAEGIACVWTYHIVHGPKGEDVKNALCGMEVMAKQTPLERWRFYGDGHIPYKYCDKCEKKMKEMKDD